MTCGVVGDLYEVALAGKSNLLKKKQSDVIIKELEMILSNVFFTSDTHFGHKNILKYSRRPFKSIEEHDEALIENWNSVVQKNDDVYHLGDFALGGDVKSIVPRLNGRVHLILGNHDQKIKKKKNLRELFSSVQQYKETRIWDDEMDIQQYLMLFHFPIESWNKRHHGSWHLHGHCHGTLPSPDWQARVDVGVDVWDYTPVSYEQIKEHMTNKVFKPIDHHNKRR